MTQLYLGGAEFDGRKHYGVFEVAEDKVRFHPVADEFQVLVELLQRSSTIESLLESSKREAVESFRYLPPTEPTKIVAVGLNYKDHANEFGQEVPEEPLIFLKPPSALAGNLQEIVIPEDAHQVDYEGELAIVIKKRARKVSEKEASEYILGYTCSNDVTERFYQKRDGQWARAKGFDTFAPVGPWISTFADPLEGLEIVTEVNGQLKQSSNTLNMIFNPFRLVSFVSKVMTLEAGDIIMTGTPSGVGKLKPGDEVCVKIEQIGCLKNFVVQKG